MTRQPPVLTKSAWSKAACCCVATQFYLFYVRIATRWRESERIGDTPLTAKADRALLLFMGEGDSITATTEPCGCLA